MKTEIIQSSQVVVLFDDSDTTAMQHVYIDKTDGFMSIIHAGSEIVLSLSNWIDLCKLADSVIHQMESSKVDKKCRH